MSGLDQFSVISDFVSILEKLKISYLIGGLLASSLYGAVRFTEDADITVEPFDSKADEFLKSLYGNYYVSSEAMHQALVDKTSFNIIHIKTAFKIDVFVQPNQPYEKQMLSRGIKRKLSDTVDKEFNFVTPEDIVLLKINWYVQGGRVSERQRNDVMGVLRVQAENLDYDYLNKWARKLGFSTELDKLLDEVGGCDYKP